MEKITLEGNVAQFCTKLEINPDNRNLKYSRVQEKSDETRKINQRLDKVRMLIERYDDMMKDDGFATALKLKNAFLYIEVMDDSLLIELTKDFKRV